MGFFDDVKNSLTEKSQDLSKKAKDTTEIYRLNNANKSMEKRSREAYLSDWIKRLCKSQRRVCREMSGSD